MSSTEIVPAGSNSLADRMQWAKALATADMLPRQFRNQPGNVLLAQEYALSLSVPVGQVLAGAIHVIEGTPSMSAGLMQALVRRAGHRVRQGGDTTRAWCEIVRRDDPDYPFRIEFTIDDAKRAGLMGKDNWKNYPRSMLAARALSECARLACSDVLAGVSYIPDELGVVELGPSEYGPVASPTGVSTGPTMVDGAERPGRAPTSTAQRDESQPGEPISYTDPAPSDKEHTPEPGPHNWRDVEVTQDWRNALIRAAENADLAAIHALGNTALESDWPERVAMAEQARQVWQATKSRIESEY